MLSTNAEGFDPLAWLISFEPFKARRLAYACLVISMASLSLLTYSLARMPWELNEASPTTEVYNRQCGLPGGVLSIHVGNRLYTCTGDDNKCGWGDNGPVSYNPKHPGHCRLRKNLHRPSTNELLLLLLGALPVPYAVAFFSWSAAWLARAKGGLPKAYQVARALCLLELFACVLYLLWSCIQQPAL